MSKQGKVNKTKMLIVNFMIAGLSIFVFHCDNVVDSIQNPTEEGDDITEQRLHKLTSAAFGLKYDVYIDRDSHKRYARRVTDGGHQEVYCKTPDLDFVNCSVAINMDGVKLSAGETELVAGPYPYMYPRTIEGSLNHWSGAKWEWPDETLWSFPESVRWTYRPTGFLDLVYTKILWNGNSPGPAVIRAKWFESDPANVTRQPAAVLWI